jgi:glycosyltransferase involved in cell wall biosynthesis
MVSIGLPVRNGAAYIQTCLDSICGQTFRDIELIVSDNDSTDATVEICERYAAKDPRVRLFRQRANIGPAGNFRFVLEQARASSFMWVACDDYYESQELVGALYERSRAGAALAVPNIKHRDMTTEPPTLHDHPVERDAFRRASTQYEFLTAFVTSPHFPIAVYGMFNRDVLREVGVDLRLDPALLCGGDNDLIHRVIAGSGRIEFVDSVSLVYSRRRDSASSSSKRTQRLRDFVEYNRRLPGIYARSKLHPLERVGLLGRLVPVHAYTFGVLIASSIKHWVADEWASRSRP